jgi:hypothetical protein
VLANRSDIDLDRQVTFPCRRAGRVVSLLTVLAARRRGQERATLGNERDRQLRRPLVIADGLIRLGHLRHGSCGDFDKDVPGSGAIEMSTASATARFMDFSW